MKLAYWVIFCCVLSLSCKKETTKTQQKHSVRQDTLKVIQQKDSLNKLHFSKCKDYVLTGKFYNLNTIDTLRFKYYSFLSEKYLDSIPNSYDNDWELRENYFLKKNIGLKLISKKSQFEFYPQYGFFFIQNIGDNNNDGIDEIAIVNDYVDFTKINHCYIKQFCKSEWKDLFHFKVNEMHSFDFTSKVEEEKYKHSILDCFKKRGKYWYYADYFETFNDTIDGLPNFKKLKLEKCK